MFGHIRKISSIMSPSKGKHSPDFPDESQWTEIDVKSPAKVELPKDKKKENTGKDKEIKPSGVEVSVKLKVTSPKGDTNNASAGSSTAIQYLQTAMQSLSLHSQQLVSAKSKAQRIYIHCIRHAESHHNVRTLSYEVRKHLKDPRLTVHGIKQARALATRFKHMDKVTHIICSPLRRTIHTAYVGLGPAIFDKNIQIIAYPDVREWGNAPCNTGVNMSTLMKKFVELEGKVETSLAPDGWEKNKEVTKPYPEYKQTRAEKVRKELWELGQVSLKGGKGIWNGIEVKDVKKNRDVHIAVVSHAGFLATLEGEAYERLYNAEYKTYEFATEEMVANGASQSDLIETEESKQYVHEHL